MERIHSIHKILAAVAMLAACPSLFASDAHLDSLIRVALAASPKLQMLRSEQAAAEDAIPAQSNLPDPMLMLGVMNVPVNTFSFSQDPMTGKAVGVSQAFPFPGALASRARWLAMDTAILSEEIINAENDIAQNVKQLYFNLIDVRLSLYATDSIKQLLKNIQEVVNAKYAVSTASQQNVLKTAIEITNMDDAIDELHGKESDIQNRLNAYLLRNAGAAIYTGDLPSIDSLHFAESEIMGVAMLHSPMLLIPQLQKRQSELQAETYRYDYYPTFSVTAQYMQRDQLTGGQSQSDMVSGSVGISIPLNYGGKVSARIQEASEMKESYSYQYNTAMQHHAANIGAILSELQSLQTRARLQREGLLPQAQANLASSIANYQVGRIDFLDVIDAEKMLYSVEIKLYDLTTEYLVNVAKLEFLAGAPLLH